MVLDVCPAPWQCGAFSWRSVTSQNLGGLLRFYAVHEPQRTPAALLTQLAENLEVEVAVVALTVEGLGQSLSFEGVSQMDSILPDRLLALVRPGNDLVLRRIRNLKRCVEACGCKIMTPRLQVAFQTSQPLQG